MKQTVRDLYSNLESLGQQTVTLHGWVRNHRAQKAFGFIDLSDGTFFETVQVVYEESLTPDFSAVQKIRIGSSIKVVGTLVLTPDMKQPFEVKADTVELIGDALEDYPIQPKRHSREFLREHAHLRPRTNLFTAVFRVRSLLTHAIHTFFQDKHFVHVASPLITTNDAEGAGQLFQVTTLDLDNLPRTKDGAIDYGKDFFARKANLSVTGQLQAEIFAQAFTNVYTFGPTFRAEKSNTPTHASEFWMIEPEMAFCDLAMNMDVAEEMVKYIIQYVLERAPKEMAFFDKFVQKGLLEKLDHVLKTPFARITHQEAVDKLLAAPVSFEHAPNHRGDLATEHEKYLVKAMGGPVFVIDWPKDIKAFYMRLNDDLETVAAMDLLVPGAGELIGGSQREERLEVLKERMRAMHVPEEELWWYLDLRKYGTTPHSGYGLGFDRMLMYLTGVENIRDVIPFPRTPRQCEF
ncbi:MAG: asparagine--tRNA ligase [Acholeplasmatales bacterium]|nr:MAG: asparagine--tRNA ligase [Acholeplasmatales bacterium]